MSAVELNEAFLARIAGWEAMKQARASLIAGHVLSSHWSPPVLKGVVSEGGNSLRAGLVIKDSIDIENLCSCRASRQWGTMCSHSVAVGLHHLRGDVKSATPANARTSSTDSGSVSGMPRVETSAAKRNLDTGPRLKRALSGANAPELELYFLFPPNLGDALKRGTVMLCCEAKVHGKRSLLSVLPRQTAYAVGEEDAPVLGLLEEWAGGEPPAMVQMSASMLLQLLPLLKEHPRLTLGRTNTLQVRGDAWRPALSAGMTHTGEILLELKQKPEGILSHPEGGVWIYQKGVFQSCQIPSKYQNVFHEKVVIPRVQVPVFVSVDWPLLIRYSVFESTVRPDQFCFEPLEPRFHLQLSGGLAQLKALVQCAYGNRIMTLGVTDAKEEVWMPDPQDPFRYATRNLAAEQSALGRLMRHGFRGPDVQGVYELRGQDSVLRFFAREYPRLQREWSVTLEQRLESSQRQHLEWIEPQLQVVSSGQQWFDLAVKFESVSGEHFSPSEIQRLVLSGQSHVRMRNGRIALIDTESVESFQEVLQDCAPQQHDQGFRISQEQAGFLSASLQDHPHWQVRAPEDWKRNVMALSGEAERPCPPLGHLEEILRAYQKRGVAWLWFLRQHGFGGILADDMGLGKTLQALAYLEGVYAQPDIPAQPSLVVCPTSLVFNWVAEAKRFTPGLRVVAVEGEASQRAMLFAGLASSQVVVTSYALLRRDADFYRDLVFDSVILDEAQHIKNRQTLNAQAVKSIRSQHRMVLTGTPLENSVQDLWSIYDFLMPGYLGSAREFRERYELPIMRDRVPEAQLRLQRRVRPFFLRRLKQEVAPELPAKIEQLVYCDLTDQQKAVYQQILELGRREVMESVGEQGLSKSRMVILSVLLRLRQACCDLRLLPLSEVDPTRSSAKLDMLEELLEEAWDGGHRVLVFSQFVSLLHLVRERLEQREVNFCYLDGSTTDRAREVEKFQQSKDVPVFLISLKAGGTGLNLTAADTVVHLDPWWNPAVEVQATDRAHRIGQTRVVTSYKLIARDTVEEKILQLQARKRELIEQTLAGEESFAEALGWEEVQELFSS